MLRACGIAAVTVAALLLRALLSPERLEVLHLASNSPAEAAASPVVEQRAENRLRRSMFAVQSRLALQPARFSAPHELLLTQCALVHNKEACADFLAQRHLSVERQQDVAGLYAAHLALKSCEGGCHGRGVCNQATGECACIAGYNGTTCATHNLRPCNGDNDGGWVASHCAGECDEARGFCWCPGRVGERPMGESCQPTRMPLQAFGALRLPADLRASVLLPNGTEMLGANPDRKQLEWRRREFDAVKDALQRDPSRRATVLRRFWFGDDPWAPMVDIAPSGVPHTRLREPAAGAAGGGGVRVEVASALKSAGMASSLSHGLLKKGSARQTWPLQTVLPVPLDEASAPAGGTRPWCAAKTAGELAHDCRCAYDGIHGPLCEQRHEAFCLNQCSGHGMCDVTGGHCHCDHGFFGVDCSMTTRATRPKSPAEVALHEEHASFSLRPRRPYIYVYELPEHTTLVLQYRASRAYCSHRHFNEVNATQFNSGYAYTIDVALHEWLLRSRHRVVDPGMADYFYVPLYLSCAILPVYDYVGPAAYAHGYPMRPVTASRMALDALDHLRSTLPFWNASGGADHIFLFSHDEGGCWAPEEISRSSIILSHWGRMDEHPHSSSRYMADNWEADWRSDTRAIAGGRWRFPRGSRGMIGVHPCHLPLKDIVIPVFAPPSTWSMSPFLTGDGEHPRPVFAYFSGNLAEREPLKYARGIRHRLRTTFQGKPGWKLVGHRGGRYALELREAEFCIVPPGGDGWSSRVDDAVRAGCIPVIIMDRVLMPFESEIDYSAFAIRVAEADVEKTDEILRAVPAERRQQMRQAMRRLWLRFTYAQAIFDDDRYLPRADLPPVAELRRVPLTGLRRLIDSDNASAIDALDTIMMVLHRKLGASMRRRSIPS